MTVPWPPGPELAPDTAADAAMLALMNHALQPRTLAVLLIRRGGWAVGISEPDSLAVHKTGKRYVQGATAAGGWSQQRFARRRENQAQALLAAAIAAASTRLRGDLDGLIIGGDRALLDLALADPRLRKVAALPRSPLLAIADPGAAVLAAAGARGRAIRIRLDQDERGDCATE